MNNKGVMTIKLQAYETVEKTVKVSGNSGRVYVPREWIGKKVKVLLLESLENDESSENGEKVQ